MLDLLALQRPALALVVLPKRSVLAEAGLNVLAPHLLPLLCWLVASEVLNLACMCLLSCHPAFFCGLVVESVFAPGFSCVNLCASPALVITALSHSSSVPILVFGNFAQCSDSCIGRRSCQLLIDFFTLSAIGQHAARWPFCDGIA